jgi:hypothetical protein
MKNINKTEHLSLCKPFLPYKMSTLKARSLP